jgi:hypothetical protein
MMLDKCLYHGDAALIGYGESDNIEEKNEPTEQERQSW